MCLDPVEDTGIVEGGEPSRPTAALNLGKYELVGFISGEAAGDDGGEEAAGIQMKTEWPALRVRLGGVVTIIVVSLFQVTVDEIGEVEAAVVSIVVVIL